MEASQTRAVGLSMLWAMRNCRSGWRMREVRGFTRSSRRSLRWGRVSTGRASGPFPPSRDWHGGVRTTGGWVALLHRSKRGRSLGIGRPKALWHGGSRALWHGGSRLLPPLASPPRPQAVVGRAGDPAGCRRPGPAVAERGQARRSGPAAPVRGGRGPQPLAGGPIPAVSRCRDPSHHPSSAALGPACLLNTPWSSRASGKEAGKYKRHTGDIRDGDRLDAQPLDRREQGGWQAAERRCPAVLASRGEGLA